MRKIELEQIEKITPGNSESFIAEKSVKKEHLEEAVQEMLGSIGNYSELPVINANPQDSAELILYVKMPDGKMSPHICPITYFAEYIIDYMKKQETLLIGE